MVEDNTQEVVQNTEQTSETETASPSEPTEPKEPVETPPALTPELERRVQELIAKETAKAVQEAKELGKRELQSAQDRNKAELAKAQRRAELAEKTLGAARTHIQNIDPEVAKEMELAELREREKGRLTQEQQEALAKEQEAQARAIQESLANHLKTLGIDPKDPRLDWADDSTDYVEGRARFDASVAKIVQEEKETIQSSFEKRLKDLEAKIAERETEANSVNTSTPQGVVEGSDEDFVKKFANYEIPDTKENRARYQKILEQS